MAFPEKPGFQVQIANKNKGERSSKTGFTNGACPGMDGRKRRTIAGRQSDGPGGSPIASELTWRNLRR
ncbi:hypothetical protein ACFPMF_06745 [Larkinella bovis]|uniref:Uncharacterized protein n=1 Tax=Larkinella bovis TaxID=683041 RepID=A0ABW0I640_9BACT